MKKFAICDFRYINFLRKKLNEYSYEVFESYKDYDLHQAVMGHTDLHIFYSKKGLYISEKSFRYYKNIFEIYKLPINKIGESPCSPYPEDVKLNAIELRNKLICNEKYISKEIINLYEKEDIIKVKQGYTRCSTAQVSDNNIITDDIDIAKNLKKHKFNVLYIEKGIVELYPYKYGFIGGACGSDEKNFYLSGRIRDKEYERKIRIFVEESGKRLIYLSDYDIFDVGSIFLFRSGDYE